ncbi:restriction endonuclease subunit S [Blautia wexlerae]|uniref:restriction endonuclease subunit S n=1 Tax=Blautia wexlerae TaxID=418240 RepID=UPI00189A1E4E|nr:restriction endonuclease subunit S [Blautia wexlerae]
MDFTITRFGDFALFKYGKMPKKSEIKENGKYPIYSGYRYVGYYDDYNTEANQLIIVARGVGGTGDVKLTKERCYLTNLSISAQIDESVVLPQYLYYYFSLRNLRYLDSGSAQSQITISDLEKVEIPLPNIESQMRIVDCLSMLDYKIRTNEMINNNLAEQSQAIFTEYMNCYPYKLTPLGDMAEIIDCLHSKKPEAVSDTTLQLLQLNNITDSGFLDLSLKYYISKSDYDNWTRKCEIVEGDCVITNVGRIGAVSQAPVGTHAAMGRNMTCIRLKKDKPFHSYLITALLSNHIRKEIMKNTDEGTIMGALNVKNIPLLLFPVFETSVMVQLENILSPIRKTIEQNYLSNQTLTQTRDTLLPKLMSGELDVSDIDL